MERQIVCVHIPKFEVALARLENPSLRTKPLAIASMRTSRTIIRETSHEAEEAGVVPGLPADRARRRCPSLQLIPPNPSGVTQAHQALLSSITPLAPIWEPVRPGHVFLDLTGTTRLFGRACDTAMRVERDLTQRTGLHAVAGIGTNKLIAQMATTVLTPPQLCDVRPGSEQTFLGPLPIATFPGLRGSQGATLRTILADLNLHVIQDLAEISLEALEPVLGRWALQLYQWARGVDSSPVFPPTRIPTLIRSHLFEPDTIEYSHLISGLSSLTDDLCRQLRHQHHVSNRLTLTLQYSDQYITHRSLSLATPTQWEVNMFPAIHTLLTRCFLRRVRVRSLTIRANTFRLPPQQLSLFDADSETHTQNPPRAHRLALALDRLRARFGPHSIWLGRSKAPTVPHSSSNRHCISEEDSVETHTISSS